MFCQKIINGIPWPMPFQDASATPSIYYNPPDDVDSYTPSCTDCETEKPRGNWFSRILNGIYQTGRSWVREMLGLKREQDPHTMGWPSNGAIIDDAGLFSNDLTDFRLPGPPDCENPFRTKHGLFSADPAGWNLFW